MTKLNTFAAALVAAALLGLALFIQDSIRQETPSMIFDYDAPMQKFRLDADHHLEYWQWQRNPLAAKQGITWVVAGIGGPGGRIDYDTANILIAIFAEGAPIVDRVIVVQLRGHGVTNELDCYDDEPGDDCERRLLDSGIDPTQYHYLTYADDIIRLRRHLNISEWYVTGTSYSGRVASAMALLDASATRALLVDAPVSTIPSDTEIWSESTQLRLALRKFAEACVLLDTCLPGKRQTEKREQLQQFIDHFESPTAAVYGINHQRVSKREWAYGIFNLMYSDFDLLQEWMALHLAHPEGFSAGLMTNELYDLLRDAPATYGIAPFSDSDMVEYIPNKWTECNELTGESTFNFRDFGVYGSYPEMVDYCWTVPDLTALHGKTSSVPTIVTWSPFDPVITQADVKSYESIFTDLSTCHFMHPSHGIGDEEFAQLVTLLSEGSNRPLPSFCHDNVDATLDRLQLPD